MHLRTHTWLADDSQACESIADAAWDALQSKCTTRFVAYAFERAHDGVGNDNFLCEPDERCILNRNRGVYPGHGDLTTLTLGDTEGVVQIPSFGDIVLERYDENGP